MKNPRSFKSWAEALSFCAKELGCEQRLVQALGGSMNETPQPEFQPDAPSADDE